MNTQGFLVVDTVNHYARYFDCERKNLAFEICKDELFRSVIVSKANDDYQGNEEWYKEKYTNPTLQDVKNLADKWALAEIAQFDIYDRNSLDKGITF